MKNLLKKDVKWSISEVEYIVRNVPYYETNSEAGESISVGVSLKLAMIRDLMVANEIPTDVDFDLVADLKFGDL